MKKLLVICVTFIFLVSVPLFAEWKIGNIVDDFGDPTGERFVYTIVEGTFSNSATTSSPCSVRILSQYDVTPFPKEYWTFEIHEYGFDNPVNTFRSTSKGSIKLKDELGKVYSYDTANHKYVNYWNRLMGTNARQFTDIIRNNTNIKVSVSCDSTRYNFEIPTDGASDKINTVENSIIPNIGTWIKEDENPILLEFYDMLIAKYRELNISKAFPLYSWNYYEVIPVSGVRYLIHLAVNDDDFAKNGYAKFTVSAYSLDDKNVAAKSYGDVSKVTFIIDGKDYTLSVKDPKESTSFTNMAEMKNISKALMYSKFTSITISFVENKAPLELVLNGQAMAKIINSL